MFNIKGPKNMGLRNTQLCTTKKRLHFSHAGLLLSEPKFFMVNRDHVVILVNARTAVME